jgi:uncharacterized membrane protein
MQVNYNKQIVTDYAANMRADARSHMAGRFGFIFVIGLLYMALTTLIPQWIAEVMSGTDELLAMIQSGAIYSPGAINQMLGDVFAEVAKSSSIGTLYGILLIGAFSLGFAVFCLKARRMQNPEAGDLFIGFKNYGRALVLYLLITVFTFLWSLLFIIPGIIAAFRYSMAFYVLADNPEISAMDALRTSKELMKGNKGKLFCLWISFIGWAILCSIIATAAVSIIAIPFGLIGVSAIAAILSPVIYAVCFANFTVYMEFATAAFYERVAGIYNPQIQQQPTFSNPYASGGGPAA